MSEYEASPLSRADIRDFANDIRKFCKCENVPYFPIVQFLEFVMPSLDPEFTWVPVSKQEMGSKHGLAYPNNKLIKIREDVYEGALQGKGRDRLTIAHEVGHYFMHKQGNIYFARSMGVAEKLPAYRDPEWQANAFAGELLAPAHIIKGKNIFEVANLCGISQQAARRQLEACDK
ncbi:Zn-dependent peptidase ImmA (M78 family) [Paenibacillus sp. SORGH_AS306]|uniref:ImmA/IrrE family metallo-endopeptidase n=1 Tax=unclassified Paenibacillus TaxID=185978 RepID=UPI00277EF3B5|nr:MULTISPECIES: ImmA/IrrE family metallo-endopeptidase [unclassified Paenibacillus]MDQ1236709.1 Zn-dependent peptidase ImmA (M78 family) [Paenibacillus sp. SORGH_AS_0306]MDR6109066.1 Zn-dependent peptidase ImmA (M78 family) [Paenibacillus sp. SORGH_AS_0338]